MAHADSPTKLCGEVGCGRPLRARGLCATHYNQRHQPDRHKKIEVLCGWCRSPCAKTKDVRYAERFCSLACRDTWTKRNRLPVPYAGSCVLPPVEGWTPRKREAQAKLRRAAAGTMGGLWTCGRCARCGACFVSHVKNDIGRYCSTACKQRTSSSRRRAVERNATHERYSRHAIFERDRWRCHICRRTTDATRVVPHPRAPTIDHLVPLVEGGSDTAANVATACFLCNSTRGNRGGGEQLALM